MQSWFNLFKSGLQRTTPEDPVSGEFAGGGLGNLKLLKPYLSRYWKKFLMGSLIVLAVALLAFPVPLINRYLIDDVILAGRMDLLVWAVLALVGMKLLTSGIGMAQSFIFTQLQMDFSLELQESLLNHTLSLPRMFFDNKETGYLMSRVSSDAQELTWFFSQSTVNILSNLIRFIGGAILLFVLEWRLALVTLLLLPLLVIAVRAFSSRMRILGQNSMEKRARVFTRFEETLSSVPLIKAFTTEKTESNRVVDQIRESQDISMEQSVVGSVISTIFNLVPDMAKGVVLVAGAYWIIKGDWTLGSLLAFQSYIGFVFGPAMSLAYVNVEMQNALASLDRVAALMKIIPESDGSGMLIDHLKGSIRFENVEFTYDKNGKVIKNVSFEVSPGEHIAIVGPSGVGKTTLINLLLRFYKPVKGDIYFDGKKADQYELNSLRQRIGLVSQANLLLAGTIRKNLCYGNPDASDEEVLNAARVAGIADFILGLPQQFESLVGENGVNLSEGQKQRLSIARALLKAPDILVMDEPTSALDRSTEESILDKLPVEVKGKTLIIVSHRLSTVRKVDKILVLKDGRLAGFGTHSRLVEENLYYREMVLSGRVGQVN